VNTAVKLIPVIIKKVCIAVMHAIKLLIENEKVKKLIDYHITRC
jgi:hypothetical protein